MPMHIPIGFSSLGDPSLSLDGCASLAAEFGMDFIELRVLEGEMDLPEYFRKRGMPAPVNLVRLLASSLQLVYATPSDIDSFLRFGELANAMDAPYVRVFGGGGDGQKMTAQQIRKAADTVCLLREAIRREGWRFTMLLETHSAFSVPRYCSELNALLESPVLILWDSHHTWKIAGESLEDSWKALGPWVRHVHYKDSVPDGTAHHYVPPGRGTFPGDALYHLLHDAGFQGGISLEWEKLWHPQIPPLREALSAFRDVVRGWRNAGAVLQ